MAEVVEAALEETEVKVEGSYLNNLLPALQRLDMLIERAVTSVPTVHGPEAATDHFRGLYISREEVERLLRRPPGQPLFGAALKAASAEIKPGLAAQPPDKVEAQSNHSDDTDTLPEPDLPAPGFFSFISRWLNRKPDNAILPPLSGQPEIETPVSPVAASPASEEETAAAPSSMPPVTASPQMAWLQNSFNLTPFDLDIILVALAPELDTRYERLYAYLQDDVSRRRPSVDLMLNLLCPTADARLSRRVHFTPQAPLLRHRLIHLIPARDEADVPLLAHHVKLDGQITRFLLQQQTLDPRLAPFCRLLQPNVYMTDLAIPVTTGNALLELVAEAREERRPLYLYFQGPVGNLRRLTAEALAQELDVRLLLVDMGETLAADRDLEWTPSLLLREAWLQDALLYLDGLDMLIEDSRHPARERLLAALSTSGSITLMSGTQPWLPSAQTTLGVVTVPFPLPDLEQRLTQWRTYLEAAEIDLTGDEVVRLAGRFRLTPIQIAEATAMAVQQANWRSAVNQADEPSQPTLADLFAAARAQTGHDLAALAPRIAPIFKWQDIVLPDDTKAQLREIIQRVDQRHRVLGEWGFAGKLSRSRGVNVLFAGPSGTGKTMAAEIMARELELDLYKIDLSGVVSKYIGETEKNLDRIFRAAENANAILFFDEADALFGKRSEVRDSHDRYANIEISYLLQKMEEHDGITILATNLRQNLDEAFIRRLAYTIHFPFPDEAGRLEIWRRIWPSQTRLAENVDPAFLARKFKLSGGNIRNVALAAAFLAAAEDSQQVTMDHLTRAIHREYQKMGQRLS